MYKMKTYKIPLVPGPTSVPAEYREAYMTDYGSSDLEDDFYQLLAENQQLLQRVLKTENSVTIQSGEGMLVLWSAMKSALKPGDKVLCVSNGIFGDGFADMVKAAGAEAEILRAEEGKFVTMSELREKLLSYKPDMVTAVHCETPSGLLNPISEVAKAVRESGALFCVDFVASAVGADVCVDEWGIDLGLLGSQKCLSLLPDISMLTVSARAWKKIEEVNYQGYDAALPWRDAIEKKYMPCTHNWHANAALNLALKSVLAEGLEESFQRHREAAAYCRHRIRDMGLELFAKDESLASPTVTAVMVPQGWTWPELDGALRSEGMGVGGSYGDLAGKVFRIGHMGSQANMELVEKGMDVLEAVLASKK
jgi:aspartate aminotransferase-like enzyme